MVLRCALNTDNSGSLKGHFSVGAGVHLPSHTASAYHARVTLRHQSSSAQALLVKGWREGSDGITSNIPHGGKG